ncbi:MAG: NTP transferase domain-containing protein [Pseudomonadota bacterium]
MKFARITLAKAAGAILAHATTAGGRRFAKGHLLSREDIAFLAAAGIGQVTAVRLETGDVTEDGAAGAIAQAVAGEAVTIGAPATGRANLFAATAGVALIDSAAVTRINSVDEAITLATLAPFTPVAAGQMLATVKIIPFAVSAGKLRTVLAHAATAPILRVRPFTPHQAGLISTHLPGAKEPLHAKTAEIIAKRLAILGSALADHAIVPHEVESIAAALARQAAHGLDPLLVIGASATVDRRDVVPSAIRAAGGRIARFGMPVDPGNLLLHGRLGGIQVIGLPGCARSPRLNGFDWVLERVLAGLDITRGDWARMGVGGLLKEIASRPCPRLGAQKTARAKIAALVLAAGQSRRMGKTNKLRAMLDGKPLVAHAVDAALASTASPVIVVVGHEADAVAAALAASPARFVHAADSPAGLSRSLAAGLAAVPADCDGAVICLGDMPDITAPVIDRLIAAYDPSQGREIAIAAYRGKRGNPVLVGRRLFPAIAAHTGDSGAKAVIARHEDLVALVEMDDPAVLYDIDTRDALARRRARASKA